MAYAAALEKQASVLATELAQRDFEQLQHMPEEHAAAAALYRKAAGVYEHASKEYVSQLTGPKQADRCHPLLYLETAPSQHRLVLFLSLGPPSKCM